jgi:hypothetical protein
VVGNEHPFIHSRKGSIGSEREFPFIRRCSRDSRTRAGNRFESVEREFLEALVPCVVASKLATASKPARKNKRKDAPVSSPSLGSDSEHENGKEIV